MRTGKRTIDASLQCTVLQTQASDNWRCAVVVPTTTSKRAVVRNRIKRLISESIAHRNPQLPLGIDLIFFVKKGFNYDSQQQANNQVQSLLTRAGFSIES